jgi:hypothetical protein
MSCENLGFEWPNFPNCIYSGHWSHNFSSKPRLSLDGNIVPWVSMLSTMCPRTTCSLFIISSGRRG